MLDPETITKDFLQRLPPPVVPPNGFDASAATNVQLVKNGLPPRPDQKTHPKLRALWERMMSRPIQYSTQQFKVSEKPVIPIGTSDAYAGAIITHPPSGQTFNTVSAGWTAVSVEPPPKYAKTPGQYWATMQVSMDCGYPIISGVRFSVGTTAVVSINELGNVDPDNSYTTAWFNWTDSPVMATGIPVTPGDTVYCTICGTAGSDEATFAFTNETTGMSTGFQTIPSPLDAATGGRITIEGESIGWLVWGGVDLAGGVTTIPDPADYGSVTFVDVTGSSRTSDGTASQEINLASPNLQLVNEVTMTGGDDSTTIEESPTAFIVRAYL